MQRLKEIKCIDFPIEKNLPEVSPTHTPCKETQSDTKELATSKDEGRSEKNSLAKDWIKWLVESQWGGLIHGVEGSNTWLQKSMDFCVSR